MVAEERYCVDILLEVSAVQGVLGQAPNRLGGRQIEGCVAAACPTGNDRERERRTDEFLEVSSRFGRPGR
ncbi:MAG: metal-sensing transcriptional repressor [Candidatus Methylomirabilales bacterium]